MDDRCGARPGDTRTPRLSLGRTRAAHARRLTGPPAHLQDAVGVVRQQAVAGPSVLPATRIRHRRGAGRRAGIDPKCSGTCESRRRGWPGPGPGPGRGPGRITGCQRRHQPLSSLRRSSADSPAETVSITAAAAASGLAGEHCGGGQGTASKVMTCGACGVSRNGPRTPCRAGRGEGRLRAPALFIVAVHRGCRVYRLKPCSLASACTP